jgi:branched-chain amino acid transport system permease protein
MSGPPASSILTRGRWRPAEWVWWALALGAWFVFPDDRDFGTSVLIMVMVVLSYDLLLGFAGVLSFGHAVFFGLGAFIAGWLSLAGWTEPISTVVLGGLGAALLAALVGPFVLRLGGLPLVMVTLALGALVLEAAQKATGITGGSDGLNGISFAPILGFFDWGLGGATQYLYVLAWLVAVYVVLRRITASPFGVVLQGIRENPARMRLAGNGLLPHLTAAFSISAGIAGLAGALLVETTLFVGLGVLDPDNSINVLVMLVLGGVGSLHGALVGVPLYMLLSHFTTQWGPFYWMFAIGVLLISVVLFGRGGVLGLVQNAWRGRRQRGSDRRRG